MQANPRTADSAVPITLSDDERATLRRIIQLAATGMGEGIEHAGSVQELDAAIADVLAYAKVAHATKNGTLEADAAVVDYLRTERDDAVEYVAGEECILAKVRTGDERHRFVGESAADAERRQLADIGLERDDLQVLEGVIGRLEATR